MAGQPLSGGPQEWPLRVGRILDHAARFHPRREIFWRDPAGAVATTNWHDVRVGALRVAQAFARMGAEVGDRIGVMAWNTAPHLEAWYGVPGAGGIVHSLNPRLFAGQLEYIINHAADRWIMLDADLVSVLEPIAERLPSVEGYIVFDGADGMPETSLPNAISFEQFRSDADGDFDWLPVDERTQCGLCYTSGTTGDPKGTIYTHRTQVLHAMACLQVDVLGISSRDRVFPVVPFFHANGWSTSFGAPMAGAGMVLPGRDLTPAALHEMVSCGATVALAVPTVWLDFLAWLDAEGQQVPSLNRVVIGGSACPGSVISKFQEDYGVDVIHAWGMTETSPLGALCTMRPEVANASGEEKMRTQLRCGHPFFSVDMKVVGEDGNEVPWDGETTGNLFIRGPGVVGRYYGRDTDAVDAEGWFDTGDIASMDANAYMRIADRAKDVIKSGGEWISSIDIENIAVGHPAVAEAAAVARPDERWGERPVLFVVRAPGVDADPEEIRSWLGEHMAKWQVPDAVFFIDEIPHTATRKIAKNQLRTLLEQDEYQQ